MVCRERFTAIDDYLPIAGIPRRIAGSVSHAGNMREMAASGMEVAGP
jgi:hypothetical protein